MRCCRGSCDVGDLAVRVGRIGGAGNRLNQTMHGHGVPGQGDHAVGREAAQRLGQLGFPHRGGQQVPRDAVRMPVG